MVLRQNANNLKIREQIFFDLQFKVNGTKITFQGAKVWILVSVVDLVAHATESQGQNSDVFVILWIGNRNVLKL